MTDNNQKSEFDKQTKKDSTSPPNPLKKFESPTFE